MENVFVLPSVPILIFLCLSLKLCEHSHTQWKPIKVGGGTHKNICLECRFSPSYGIFPENIFSGTKYSTGPITSCLIKGGFVKTMWCNSLSWLRARIKFYKFFTAAGMDMHIMLCVRAFMKCYMVALKLIADGQWVVWSICFWLLRWAGCFLGKCFLWLWTNTSLFDRPCCCHRVL